MAIAGRTMGLATVLALCAAATPVESWIDAPGPAGALKGVLLTPAKPGPALLIIPGSGQTDHDGNSPAGLRAGTYRLLAEGLAAHGITSLRIDKRGLFASRAAVPDADAVTIGDYAADVHAWIGVLRARTGQSCVWLLGHSEGGLVALVAADGRPDVCGVVLVATPGRPYGEVLRAQLHANPANAPLLAQADGAIDALEAGRHYDTAEMHPALRPLFRLAVQGFLISAFAVDPVKRGGGAACASADPARRAGPAGWRGRCARACQGRAWGRAGGAERC